MNRHTAEESIRQLAIDHLFIKLCHHDNVIAGHQKGVEDMTQDKRDSREIKKVIRWLIGLKLPKEQNKNNKL